MASFPWLAVAHRSSVKIRAVHDLDQDRYDRQRGLLDQDKISTSKVMVVGGGALGNEVVKNLALLGIGGILIVDYDHVVKSNLNRCLLFRPEDARLRTKKAIALARRVKEMNPTVKVKPVVAWVSEIDPELLNGISFAFGCLDNMASRLQLNSLTYSMGVTLIDGGIESYMGQLQTVRPPESPCLECSVTERDVTGLWERIRCGGDSDGIEGPRQFNLGTTTSIVAALQVQEFIKLASSKAESQQSSSLVGMRLFYNGLTNDFLLYEIQKKENCGTCSSTRGIRP